MVKSVNKSKGKSSVVLHGEVLFFLLKAPERERERFSRHMAQPGSMEASWGSDLRMKASRQVEDNLF